MDGPFLSPPAKRSFNNESESNPYSITNSTSKRGRGGKPLPLPISISPGQVAFRLLCHISHIGGIIGKSGSVVKLFQKETGANIRVEEPVSDCDERIVLVVGSETLKKKIELKDENGKEGAGELHVSPAQEIIYKVLNRILGIEAETEGVFPPGGGVVLLVASTQVGSVMGKVGRLLRIFGRGRRCRGDTAGTGKFVVTNLNGVVSVLGEDVQAGEGVRETV